MVLFNPGRAYYHLCQFQTSQLMQLRQLHRTNLLEVQQQNIAVNITHSSSTCNGDYVGLLIKTGSIQKYRMISQTNIRYF